MFSGLISLCTILFLSRSLKPLSSCLKQKSTSSSVLSRPSLLSFSKQLGKSPLLHSYSMMKMRLFLISPMTSSILMMLGLCRHFSRHFISCRVVATMSSIFFTQEVLEGTRIIFIANLCTRFVMTSQKQHLQTSPQEPAPNLHFSSSLQWQIKVFFMPLRWPATDRSCLQLGELLTAQNSVNRSCSSFSAIAPRVNLTTDWRILSTSCLIQQQPIKLMQTSNFSQSDMCESLNFNAHEVISDSSASEYKVNVIGLRHLPRCLSKEFSDGNDSFSIDEFNSDHKHPQVFKCFKCYGLTEGKDPRVGNKCRECQGTSFVSDSHPLVAILQQIISKEVPQLAYLPEPQKKRRLSRRNTLQQEIAIPDTIKEESFSIQEDQLPTCKNCLQECEANYHKCDRCPNIYLCPTCLQSNRYYHHHKLYPKEVSFTADLQGHALKNIVEQVESLEASKVEQPLFGCSSCRRQIEACFVNCSSCAQKGIQFNLCDHCYQDKNYQHDANHELTIKTSLFEHADMNFDKSVFGNALDGEDNALLCDEERPLRDEEETVKLKEGSLHSNSLANLADSLDGFQMAKHPTLSDFSDFHQEISELKIDPKLLKSCRTEQQYQEMEKMRFSQSREQRKQQIVAKYQQAPAQDELRQSQMNREKIRQSREDRNSHNEQSNTQEYIFKDYCCDNCGVSPIVNSKYHCEECQNYDICENCFLSSSDKHQHRSFTLIDGRKLLQRQRSLVARRVDDRFLWMSVSSRLGGKRSS